MGALTVCLAPQGIEPILVGGGALELYTDGGYGTADVDLALPQGPQVDRAFAELGCAKRGRFWERPELELDFEAPAPAGLPGETAPRTELELDGLRVVVLGVEDLLIDRLRAWVHRKRDEDGRWAARLAALYARELDWDYLRSRAPTQGRALGGNTGRRAGRPSSRPAATRPRAEAPADRAGPRARCCERAARQDASD